MGQEISVSVSGRRHGEGWGAGLGDATVGAEAGQASATACLWAPMSETLLVEVSQGGQAWGPLMRAAAR